MASLYLRAPKRCGEDSAHGNVSRLRVVVRQALRKELADAKVKDLPDLWPAYVAARQKRSRPDYATRRAENHGINSAMKQAASVFIPALRYQADNRERPSFRHSGDDQIQPAGALIVFAPVSQRSGILPHG